MRKKTYLLWKKILTILLCVFVVSSLLFIYFRTNTFTITSYELVGIPEEYKSEILNKLHTLEKEPLYKILPANKMLTYRGTRIKSIITNILPNTKDIELSPRSLHTLRIKVTPYTPLFKLDTAYAVDKNGYVFKEMTSLDAYPVLVIASSTFATTTRDGITYTSLIATNSTSTVDLLKELDTLVPKINSVLFPVGKIIVDPYGDIILSNSEGKSSLKVSQDTNIDKVWSTVISAIDTEPLKTLLLTKKDNLEYIDTRYGNKVFYKFTNTKIPTIINASTTSPYVTSTTTTVH